MGGGGKGGGEQTVGYKYYAGVHLVLCHGPIDKITEIHVDDRLAWAGTAGQSSAPVRVNINEPELFGGESREGGISGALDVLFGHPLQQIHDYLSARIGSSLVPAYRGVTSVVLRQMYMGNNPYLKPWSFTASRIHTRHDGASQWYDAKAEILEAEKVVQSDVSESFSSLEGFDPYNAAAYSVSNNVLRCDDRGGASQYLHRPLPEAEYTFASIEFRVTDHGSGDAPSFGVAGILSVVPMRERLVDSKQRLYVNGVPVGSTAVDVGVWYRVDVQAVGDENRITVYRESALISSFSTSRDGMVADRASWNTMDGSSYSGGMVTEYRNLHVRSQTVYSTGDMNPIHIIRECLTNASWGRGLPESEIGPTYEAAADQLYEEGLGISIMWTEETPIEEFIAEVMRHIDAVRYEDPETGLQEIKLIRGGYDVGSLPVLDRTNSEVTKFDTSAQSEMVNQVTVQYHNRDANTDASITVQDTAAITALGTIVNATYEYSGITRDAVAAMVAQRDLAAASRPFAKGTVVVNRQVADLKPGDLFVLNDPDNGIEEMVCRVAKRTDNGLLNGELTIEFGEDVFGTEYSIFATPTPSGWVDPVGAPQDFSHVTAYEKPYLQIVRQLGDSYIGNVPKDVGYFCLAGGRPASGAHINYDLYIYPEGVTQEPDFAYATRSDFTPFAVVSADVDDPLETTIPVAGVEDAELLRSGQLVLIGDASDDQRELAFLTSAPAEDASEVVLIRGAADTIPRPIAAGTVLYFIGAARGEDGSEYLVGETAEGYGTPVNGQGYYLGPYSYRTVDIVGRFSKPYPPANLTLNGVTLEQGVVIPEGADVVLGWNHRDRVMQSDQPIGWPEAVDYGPEAGTTYELRAVAYDAQGQFMSELEVSDLGLTQTHTFDRAQEPVGADTVVLELTAVRVGERSLQAPSVRYKPLFKPSALAAVNVILPPTGLAAENVLLAPTGLAAFNMPYAPTALSAENVLYAPTGLTAFNTDAAPGYGLYYGEYYGGGNLLIINEQNIVVD